MDQFYGHGGLLPESAGKVLVTDKVNDLVAKWNLGATEGQVVARDNLTLGSSTRNKREEMNRGGEDIFSLRRTADTVRK